MNVLECPHCSAVLTTVERMETRAYIVVNTTNMTLSAQDSDSRLRRGKPTWKGLRYWFSSNVNKIEPFKQATVSPTSDKGLREYRSVVYSCCFCKQPFNPALQGWMDPLEVLPMPDTPYEENASTTPPEWKEYTRYGLEPSLMLETEFVLDVV